MDIQDNTPHPPFDDIILQNKELLRLVLDVTQDCVLDWNLRSGLFYLSPRFYEITGYRPEEVTPNLEFWQSLIHPDDLPRVMAVVDAHLRDETPESCFDFRMITRNGTVTWFTGKGKVVERDAAGQPIRMVGVIRDITESKLAMQQSAGYLDAITRIHKLSGLFLREGNLEAVLNEIVAVAIAISGADFGNIQMLDPTTGNLRIMAQQGFPTWWCEYWDSVARGQGVCGTALHRGERIVVEDVEQSPIFLGTPALEIQRRAGVRAVQSTPMVSSSGRCVGMFSTHYRVSRRPDEHALLLLDMLARQAADTISYAQAEAALREREARFRALVQASSDVVYRMSPDWSEMLQLVGKEFIPDTEKSSSTWLETYIFPEDQPRVIATIREAIRAKSVFELEHRVRRVDGSAGWTFSRAIPVLDERGEVTCWFGCASDITSRKLAEEQLQYQATLVDRISDGIVSSDADFRIRSWNKAAERIYGWTADEAMGRIADELFRTEFPGASGEAPVAELLAKGEMSIDVIHHDKQGRRLNIQAAISVLRDMDGRVTGTVAVLHDITERKQFEEALRRSHEELELRVSERTKELVASQKILILQKEALEQKNIALREVLEQLEIEKSHLKRNIVDNLDHVVKPLLTQIRPDRISDKQLDALEQGLEDLVSTFGRKISDRKFRLTPKEVQLCNYIRNGLSNKEIARIMNLSVMTVSKHRENIRKKLEISNKSINLCTFLQNL